MAILKMYLPELRPDPRHAAVANSKKNDEVRLTATMSESEDAAECEPIAEHLHVKEVDAHFELVDEAAGEHAKDRANDNAPANVLDLELDEDLADSRDPLQPHEYSEDRLNPLAAAGGGEEAMSAVDVIRAAKIEREQLL